MRSIEGLPVQQDRFDQLAEERAEYEGMHPKPVFPVRRESVPGKKGPEGAGPNVGVRGVNPTESRSAITIGEVGQQREIKPTVGPKTPGSQPGK